MKFPMYSCSVTHRAIRFSDDRSLVAFQLLQVTVQLDHQYTDQKKQINQWQTLNKRAGLLCLVVASVMTFCWTPYQILLVLINSNLVSITRWGLYGMLVLFLLPAVNCCINPLVYGLLWKPNRQALREVYLSKRIILSMSTSRATLWYCYHSCKYD